MRNLTLLKSPDGGRREALPEIGALSIEDLQHGYNTEGFTVVNRLAMLTPDRRLILALTHF